MSYDKKSGLPSVGGKIKLDDRTEMAERMILDAKLSTLSALMVNTRPQTKEDAEAMASRVNAAFGKITFSVSE